MELIKSITNNQNDIIKSILKLYIKKSCFDLDPTYSKGIFYKNIKTPIFKSDIKPLNSTIVQSDCRNLWLEDESIDSIMFDPPFLATKGPSLKINNDSNKILKRFSVFKNEKELHQFYIDSMKEFYRVLKENGFLIFKCQDKVSSSKQYFSHVFIMNEAIKIGFYPIDLFILEAKNRMVPKWQLENQKHARKFHSYFWVFQKKDRVIEYV